jgi:carboxylate-amine ligase
LVRAGVRRILRTGNGADRQRAAFAARGDGRDVVDLVLGETAPRSSVDIDLTRQSVDRSLPIR